MVAKQETCVSQATALQPPSIIAQLNDAFRQNCTGGTLFATAGVIGLGRGALPDILAAVRAFTAFTADNDPYGEHDFGSVVWKGATIFWKVDYYDPDLTFGSQDPADASITARVLTIMLAEEY